MTFDIPTTLRDNPNLMGFMLKANAAIQGEVGAGERSLHVAWTLGVDAAARPVLTMKLSNCGTAAARFRMQDFADEPEDLRAKIREQCHDFIRHCGRRE